jgi:hypothetical protein
MNENDLINRSVTSGLDHAIPKAFNRNLKDILR